MSQEDVEVVRRGVAALAEGDWEAVLETWHPQIEWDFEREAVISGLYRGREAVRAALLSFITEWDDFGVEIEDVLAAEDRRVVICVRLTGRARLSGVPLDFREAMICTVEGGRVVHVKEYHDRAEALEAVGLRE
jgi:ketosteroid isomerase-like protein